MSQPISELKMTPEQLVRVEVRKNELLEEHRKLQSNQRKTAILDKALDMCAASGDYRITDWWFYATTNLLSPYPQLREEIALELRCNPILEMLKPLVIEYLNA